MDLKIAVIYGSVRTQRQGIRLAKFITQKCQDRNWDATLVDPVEFDLPLLDKRYFEYETDQITQKLERLNQIFSQADGYIIVSAEYNHSLPPALSNLMDHFTSQYNYKTAGIISYSSGSFGGIRSAIQLRSFLGNLKLIGIPTAMPVPSISEVFDENGKALDEKYHERTEKFLNEFEWYTQALKKAREKGLPNQ